MSNWINEKSEAGKKEEEAYGGAQRANGGGNNAASSSSYAPPPSPPPPLYGAEQQPVYQVPTLDALSTAPTYEPFHFGSAYAAQSANGPLPWHGVPSYAICLTPTGLSIHQPPPVGADLCACGPMANDCRCGRGRGVTTWQAETCNSAGDVALLRPAADPDAPGWDKALWSDRKRAIKDSKEADIRSAAGKIGVKVPVVGMKAGVFKDLDGEDIAWLTQDGGRKELIRLRDGGLMAVYHDTSASGPHYGRLDMTAFAWARMPQHELFCDFDSCTLGPLFGFAFRCKTCTDAGEDSFDLCEAHLERGCQEHVPRHVFHRIPRPHLPGDSAVNETPLLDQRSLEGQRMRFELVILTLCMQLLRRE